MPRFFHTYQQEHINLKKRYRKAWLFKSCCIMSILFVMMFLMGMIFSIMSNALDSISVYEILVNKSSKLEKIEDIEEVLNNVTKRFDVDLSIYDLFSRSSIYDLKNAKNGDVWLSVSSEIYESIKKMSKNQYDGIDSDREKIIHKIINSNNTRKSFNFKFFTSSDSRDPQSAGIFGALIGSFYTIFICFIVGFPISVMTGIYLNEYAKQNLFNDFIELTINNLAAIPSIVFGMIGLSIYIGYFDMPRSSSLVGGLTLALMSMPAMIISTRQALDSVPKMVRENVLALGASKQQAILHHVLPLSLPTIATGVILSISRAAGETAPLILIGMVAFSVNAASTIFDATSSLPVQIYLWSESPDNAIISKTSLAIMTLLFMIMILNLIATFIRKKFEKQW